MGYDLGESFPFNFEPNGIPFGSENREENIPFNMKGNGNIVFSVLASLGHAAANEAAFRHAQLLPKHDYNHQGCSRPGGTSVSFGKPIKFPHQNLPQKSRMIFYRGV